MGVRAGVERGGGLVRGKVVVERRKRSRPPRDGSPSSSTLASGQVLLAPIYVTPELAQTRDRSPAWAGPSPYLATRARNRGRSTGG